MVSYLQQIQSLFRNKVLNAVGVERDFFQLLKDGDIDKAIEMMQDRSEDVDEAIRQYHPETHDVMNRRDKLRKNSNPYEVEKLPRARQRYINEVELFFLMGTPPEYRKKNGGDDEYELFKSFGKEVRLNSLHRQWKRIAGAETEAAIVYHLYNENSAIVCKAFVAARSAGYDIRPLFDQYGNMLAFAYGYKINRGGKSVQRWEILTPDFNFECEKTNMGWKVIPRENITGKINAIYACQPTAWAGAERRIDREEMIDSKTADTNNYFADPVAYATADVVSLMGDAKDKVGKLLQFTDKNSQFGYINPPNDSATRQEEKSNLAKSILFDTFTPDLSYDSIKGMGSLSGEALQNALVLGFIKADNRKEIYGELLDREVNVIKGILKIQHPGKDFDSLDIEVVFKSPFANQEIDRWSAILNLYKGGLVSLEQAVEMLSLTDAPQEEIDKIARSVQKVSE